MKQDLLGDLKLRRNDSNASVGGRPLIPYEGILKEVVKPRKGERSILPLLRDTILGAQSSTRSYVTLWLRWRTGLLAVVLWNQNRVDITKKQKQGRWPRGRVLKIVLRLLMTCYVFYFMGCAEKVSNLINHPVVGFFGTRVVGTRVQVLCGKKRTSLRKKSFRIKTFFSFLTSTRWNGLPAKMTR